MAATATVAAAAHSPVIPQPILKKRSAARRRRTLQKLNTSAPDVSSSPISREISAQWWMSTSAELSVSPAVIPPAVLLPKLPGVPAHGGVSAPSSSQRHQQYNYFIKVIHNHFSILRIVCSHYALTLTLCIDHEC